MEQRGCPYKTEVTNGKKTLLFDCRDCPSNASLTNPQCRAAVAEAQKTENADGAVLRKGFQRVYGRKELETTLELAGLSEFSQKSLDGVSECFCEKCRPAYKKLLRFADDPIKFYYMLRATKLCGTCEKICGPKLSEIAKQLENSAAIAQAMKTGDVEVTYHRLLRPLLIPELVTSKIELEPPDAQELTNYAIGNVKVSIFTLSERPDRYYFVSYPEFTLNNAQLKALQLTFKKVTEVQPHMDMTPSAMRKNFARIADETLKGFENKELLKEIMLRHTAGYGLIEPLLMDEKLTDVYVDSGSRLIHVVHSKYGECITNIHLSADDLEKLSTRLRAVSGRPFDASSPVLHAELEEFGVRVAGIREPSTYSGTGFAFRRRKTMPWTLPEFVKADMLSAEAAGLLSFLMDGNASILVVGPRSSGKSSLLTSLLLEINQNNRIIVIEDTPEIPIPYMRSLGFKVEHLKIEAFSKGYELSAEDALRTSLRLGESILVLGEVRGPEAKALFEAMRIGAVGNVVIGTIHGSGPYDVWDRITNDLGVPSTSFKATDIILSTGIIRKGESTERHRRLFGITEVKKNWHDEPVFADLMTYSRGSDKLKTTDFWKSDTVRKVAAIKGLSKTQALANIKFRIRMRKALVEAAKRKKDLLSAEWVIAANNKCIDLMRNAKRPDYDRLFKDWSAWLKTAAK